MRRKKHWAVSYITRMIDGTVNQNCMTIEAANIDEAIQAANDMAKKLRTGEPDVTDVAIYDVSIVEDPRY